MCKYLFVWIFNYSYTHVSILPLHSLNSLTPTVLWYGQVEVCWIRTHSHICKIPVYLYVYVNIYLCKYLFKNTNSLTPTDLWYGLVRGLLDKDSFIENTAHTRTTSHTAHTRTSSLNFRGLLVMDSFTEHTAHTRTTSHTAHTRTSSLNFRGLLVMDSFTENTAHKRTTSPPFQRSVGYGLIHIYIHIYI